MWRRKSSRTHAAQGLWHQWQRHADELGGKVAAGVDALPVVMVLHNWEVDARAGVAAADIGEGTVSTASDAGNGEP